MQKFGEMCITTFRDKTHWAKLASGGTPDIPVVLALPIFFLLYLEDIGV